MTNNTIPNVPRQLLERAVQIPSKASVEENHAAIVDRGRAQAEIRALLSAPSPAGVDGCKGKNCGATDGASHSAECIAEHEQACGRADSNGLPVVACLIGGEPSLTPCPVRGVVNEPLCRLSDAQATIDGLRGEADQQAQRIGELASHLEFAVTLLTGAGLAGNAQVEAMRAALSAGVGRVK